MNTVIEVCYYISPMVTVMVP